MPRHNKITKLEQKVKNIVLKQQTKIEERKFLDTINSATLDLSITSATFPQLLQTLPTTSASVINLCAVAQGVDINQRVGNEIKVMSVNIKSVVNTFGSARSFRTMLVQDTQQISDTTPTISDIFSYWSPNQYLLNMSNNKRFKILERSDIPYGYMSIDTNGSLAPFTGANPFPSMNLFHKFKYPLKVRYNGATSADGQKNLLYLVILCSNENSQDAGTDNGSDAIVPYMCRLKYIDG